MGVVLSLLRAAAYRDLPKDTLSSPSDTDDHDIPSISSSSLSATDDHDVSTDTTSTLTATDEYDLADHEAPSLTVADDDDLPGHTPPQKFEFPFDTAPVPWLRCTASSTSMVSFSLSRRYDPSRGHTLPLNRNIRMILAELLDDNTLLNMRLANRELCSEMKDQSVERFFIFR